MNQSHSFEVSPLSGGNGAWTISLAPGVLMLVPGGGNESFEIPRSVFEEKGELKEPPFIAPRLVIKIEKLKITFELDKEQTALFKEWLGPPTRRGLRFAFKRRTRLYLVFGGLFLLGSLPMPGNPETGQLAIPFDATAATLGGLLISLSILTRIWTHRLLFLVDGCFFLILSADTVFKIIHGDSWLWSLLVIVGIRAAITGFGEYRRFASISE